MPRIIPLKSVRNFRDFGGYDTHHDRSVKSGKLFRSAHFSDTNDYDHDYLTELGLSLVVDLRYAPERKRQPNRLNQAMLRTLEYPDGDLDKTPLYAPHEMFLKEKLTKADDARQYMTESYRTRVNDPGFIDVFRQTLAHMAERPDPIVIHCAAGKDRTGTLGAIILKTLGVKDQDIMDDYMLTMKAVDVESFLEPVSKMMTERFNRTITPDALRPMFGVEPQYLEASLSAMGEFDRYLRDVLSITAEQRNSIHENFLD